MTPRQARSPVRGFTLVELMVVVTIVGVLASVAVPIFIRFQLRSRATERAVTMERFKRAIDEKLVRDGRIAPSATGTVIGNFTPAFPPTISKRPADFKQAGWREIDMDVEGNLYYSYLFISFPTGSGEEVILLVYGDLDGDKSYSIKQRNYLSGNTGFKLTYNNPSDGREDDLAF